MSAHRFPTILTAIYILSATLFGQSSPEEFVSGQARFAIKPETLEGPAYRGINEEVGNYSIFGESFTWTDEGRVLQAVHLVPWPSRIRSASLSLSAAGKSIILRHYAAVFRNDFAKRSATVVERTFIQGTTRGTEFLISGQHRWVVRQFFVGDRFYILFSQDQKDKEFLALQKMLDSFRSLGFDEYNAAIIRESEPGVVPQTVPTGIRPTDAIERNLKGSVKRIVEEIESGVGRKRMLLSEESFSNLGYLTRKITYNEGYAESIAYYGWVDGVRAANIAPVTHRGEKLLPTRGTLVGYGMPEGYNVIARAPTGQIVDLRFTSKFESKYDDEWRLIERRDIANSGSVNLIEKIAYSASGRDVRVNDGSGGFISRRFDMVDSNGNIIQTRTLDDRGNVLASQRYTYELDKHGNWIVRRSTVTQRPGVLRPNSSTVRRTIEYYD